MLRQVNAPAKFLDRWSGHVLGRLVGGFARLAGRFGSDRLPEAPRDILLIKFCCLGDAVLVMPSLRALKETFPGARVTLLCTPRTLPIFRDSPYLDEVMLFQLTGSRGFREFVTSGLPSLLGTLRRLRARHFDAVVDFDNYYNLTTFVGFAAGIATRVGFDPPGQGRRFLLTRPVPYAGDRHMVEFYLDLVRAIGADTDQRAPAIAVPAQAQEWARAFLDRSAPKPAGHPLVALSPGRSEAWHFIRWSEANFVAAGEALHRLFGAHVLLVGGSSEIQIAERMLTMLAERGVPATTAVGMTDLQQTEALLQRSDLLICNDSGPMHIAAAVGTPTLAVFGPANHHRWGPYGPDHRVARLDLDCSPCLFMGKLGVCPRRELECLDVPVDRVIQAAREMLEVRLAGSGTGA